MKLTRYSQHHLIKQPPIIRNWREQSRFQKYGYRVMTVFFWLLFLFLFRIALTPLAWVVGAESVYEMFSVKVEQQEFLQLMNLYLLIVLLLGLVFLGWARYNQLRFQNNERRTRFLPPIAPGELAAHFCVTDSLERDMRSSRRMVLQHDLQGGLTACLGSCDLPAYTQEPIPQMRHEYTYRGYLIRCDKDLHWNIYSGEQRIFSGITIESCRSHLDECQGRGDS